mgnify:CR=1 FL=1
MIYITTSKADGSPCERVYEGTKYTWYYCRTEEELVRSLLNLALADSGFKVYNVYGREFPGPEGFTVGETLWELRGFAGDPKRALKLAKLSAEFRLKGRRVEAKFYRGVPAEEVLKAGIIVLEPFVLPTLYGRWLRGKAVRPDPKATTP